MAKKRSARKKRFTFRFELGVGGLAGLVTICFCIFLWMFLLGVWAGQTVLQPESQGAASQAISRFSAKVWSRGHEAALQQPAEKDKMAAAAPHHEDSDEEPSFFTLQVAAFENEDNARQEVLNWKARGEEAFLLEPEEGARFFRVFVGRFDTLAAANDKVDEFEEAENLQAFITLLPMAGGQ